MADLASVQKLLKTSLFLQEADRLRWLQQISAMTSQELTYLEAVLLREDQAVGELVREEAMKPDAAQMQRIMQLKKSVIEKMIKKEQAVVETQEHKKAEDLLQQISQF